MIENYLTQHGMRVVSAADRNSATRHLSDEPNLIILDLQLGKDDGLDLLRAIRSRSDVPIIITTGHRRDEVDRVVGLELGADDYLTKPFGLRELLARTARCCDAAKRAWRLPIGNPLRGAANLAVAGCSIGVCAVSPIRTTSRCR